ncbi:MAG TPA: S-adenosylmethionine decarboxylase [Bacteroidia bacterium]
MERAVYMPGLHILAEIKTEDLDKLCDAEGFMTLVQNAVQNLQLKEVGRVVHAFDGAGFTAVVCLTESHLSIHTWPEYGHLTFDVFLSNFSRNNDDACRTLFDLVQKYFNPTSVQFTENRR